MDEYPLFFEARDLPAKEKEKVRRYFQKRRDSGGGDCGPIERTADNAYKISFRTKEDRERVFQKKVHTITLPDRVLHLTVSRNCPSQRPGPSSACLSQALTQANRTALEKIFKPDVFLLQYLKDNLKANQVLWERLSSIGCTVEFNLDKEEAVIREGTEKASGGSDAEEWKRQVDQVLSSLTQSYTCHHVFEPKQVKILLQDSLFTTDDIKVFSEIGHAVIVGESEGVKKRLALLEKIRSVRKEVPVVVKQFKLVEEEFSREMRVQYPDVKINRMNTTIILEGPDNEVESGATKLDELIRKVKQKRVKLQTALLTFFTSSRAISKYETRFQQSLRHPVSLDVESDLVLSSLSSEALDEAEAALSRDLVLDSSVLQGAAAVPPDINRVKELLMKAKMEENYQDLRVDVSFIPGSSGTNITMVQLVGYRDNVNKLKKVLCDYQMNQVKRQEMVELPYPELVDAFDGLLELMGIAQPKVTLKARHTPFPSVLVSGPHCQVQMFQEKLSATLSGLIKDTLDLDGVGAKRFFQAEGKMSKELVERSCQVLIREQQHMHDPNTTLNLPITRRLSSTTGTIAVNKMNLEIKLANLEDEQVNALVVPMLNRQLASTNLGNSLLKKAGNAIKFNFDKMTANCTLAPGDVLQIDAPPSLCCSKLFFIECLAWDGVRGQSVQALGNGLKKCLDLCVQQQLCSVAFPVIGPGVILKYPLREAIEVLTENICQFGLRAFNQFPLTIHIVIKPDNPNCEECYHDVIRCLSSSNMNQEGQAIFTSLTSDLDNVTMTVGQDVHLQLVFGDITNETTDVVVNSTDFTNFQDDGVCKDILTLAGPEVEAELKAAKVNEGDIFVSPSGSFPCEAIFHVCGEKSAHVIEQLVFRIIEYCEAYEFQSVAIPAICAGVGGLHPGIVAGAIIRGVKAATSSIPLCSLTKIRLVLIKSSVFLAFKEEAMQVFPTNVINRASQIPPAQQQQLSSLVEEDLSILNTTSTSERSVFLILGLSRKNVCDAKSKLENLYQTQCATQTFTQDELMSLSLDDWQDLTQLVETQGLYVEMEQSDQGNLMVTGLKDGVNQVTQRINVCLRKEVRVREEEVLYSRVTWCILRPHGNWEKLPKTANYNLENKDVTGGIVDGQGVQWHVDLQRLEATRQATRQTATLKRLENLPDFTLPLYWDSMALGEDLKVVELQPSSAEYQTVKEAFKRTVHKTVMKIERLQNIHLRRAYEVQKKCISQKNRNEGGAGEKSLYHGTTKDNCDSIMKTGFNRRFSGQNATVYGHGTYFAVKASYSADQTYSKPADDGTQLMFVARVLTGIYCLGDGTMRVPPPRSPQQPHDRFDSVVDKTDTPTMHVVFHDNQAYPDYLITFK